MSYGRDRIDKDHSGTDIPHYVPYPFFLSRSIAMNVAFPATRL